MVDYNYPSTADIEAGALECARLLHTRMFCISDYLERAFWHHYRMRVLKALANGEKVIYPVPLLTYQPTEFFGRA